MQNKFIRGTFFLTAAALISKVLGFIYIIPFTALVGTQGFALYGYAYGPYTILLSISTIGLPLAVSKFVAKYNELGNYRAGLRLLKYGMYLMILSGGISFVVLYVLAPYLAEVVVGANESSGNTMEDVQSVIRLVSFALLIIPAMSIFRGFFQGSQSMGPSAISTVIEQVVRITFILVGAYLIIHVFEGTVANAVGAAVFAAFAGGAAAFCGLLFSFIKRRGVIKRQRDESPDNEDLPIFSIMKELIGYAIPFVITGLAIPIYQNIDIFTINELFVSAGYTLGEAETINSVMRMSLILVMVPLSLATAFGMSLIPEITSAYTRGKAKEVNSQISQSMLVMMFFTLPAGIGLSILGKPVYTMIFGTGNSPELGGLVLQWYAPAAVVLALFTLTAAIMQGINQQKKLIIGITIGVLVKIFLNLALVSSLEVAGPIIATYMGFSVSILFNVYRIKKGVGFKMAPFLHSLREVTLLVIVMGSAVWGVKTLVELWLPASIGDFFGSVLISIISIIAGLLVYLGGGVRMRSVKNLFMSIKNDSFSD
ncbi:polysaccharide biosynthesis protein [Rossellomorea vietnamensis]|uniref:Polysaccharide biosynthesis protein n=1 Tax=Rossellomorea vietnamensis TaxID=218284 RepID=A0A5D4NRC1_9BACI|nr:polysaccharide biosynthesis protein [Rossellomorea vietnamensis]TYS16184.1 polysaccharide biosynthesis protein [Rossellomorea vietnamensis]